MVRSLSLAAMLVAALAGTGCATPVKPLYQWGNYQAQVYEHFKGVNSGPQAQIAVLEENLQKIRASGANVPPGYHAHLGMLYASIGKDDQAVQQLQTEKALFPESSPYMDFLLSKAKK